MSVPRPVWCLLRLRIYSSQTTYTATVKGTVKDIFGNAMGSDFSWTFTTSQAPANSGPGGPILVIASAQNPFTRYYSEILLNEGMNEFTVQDISTVTSSVLATLRYRDSWRYAFDVRASVDAEYVGQWWREIDCHASGQAIGRIAGSYQYLRHIV